MSTSFFKKKPRLSCHASVKPASSLSPFHACCSCCLSLRISLPLFVITTPSPWQARSGVTSADDVSNGAHDDISSRGHAKAQSHRLALFDGGDAYHRNKVQVLGFSVLPCGGAYSWCLVFSDAGTTGSFQVLVFSVLRQRQHIHLGCSLS